MLQPKCRQTKALIAIGSLAVGLAWASIAWGQAGQDLAPSAKVDPCVVTITLSDKSEGSGFVVDPKGLIVTNYHVIEGAKRAIVGFADKRLFRVDGFVAISPAKDLALLHIRVPDNEAQALTLAENLPAKGERVFAFGAPMGLSGSVSEGIVAAIRAGLDIRETLLKLAQRDIYKDTLGYDLDAQWIQTTAPISPGNSGGPLVNSRGEVVGVNTWVCAAGQNLNFSLSVVNLKQFMATAGANVQPLSNLPAPRANRGEERKSDAEKTLALWNGLNRLKIAYNEKIAAGEKKLQQIVPIDPSRPMKGQNARNKKKSVIYEQMAKNFGEYAGKVKALDNTDVDPDALMLSVAEADIAQRAGDACQQLATAAATLSDSGVWHGEWELDNLKRNFSNLRTVRDLIRIKLARKYDRKFPTLEETAKIAAASPSDAEPETKPSKAAVAPVVRKRDVESEDIDKLMVLRVWSDRTGKHQIQATYRGLEAGKVKLEKPDGSVISVPIEALSEADQRFIGVTP
jgi:hypothetical protein